MNKAELVDQVVQKTGLPLRDVRTIVDAIFDPDPNLGLI